MHLSKTKLALSVLAALTLTTTSGYVVASTDDIDTYNFTATGAGGVSAYGSYSIDETTETLLSLIYTVSGATVIESGYETPYPGIPPITFTASNTNRFGDTYFDISFLSYDNTSFVNYCCSHADTYFSTPYDLNLPDPGLTLNYIWISGWVIALPPTERDWPL